MKFFYNQSINKYIGKAYLSVIVFKVGNTRKTVVGQNFKKNKTKNHYPMHNNTCITKNSRG